LAWWFQRRRFLKKFTDGRRMPSDGNSSHRWAKKVWNTVRVISYQFYLYINVISVLCNPNGTLFQTCLILHVWLKLAAIM
jgi:hypothetical protein